MLYDIFMAALTAVASSGAVVFSLKIAHSPVRRVGVIRESPCADSADEALQPTLERDKLVAIEEEKNRISREKGTNQLQPVRGSGPPHEPLQLTVSRGVFFQDVKLESPGLVLVGNVGGPYVEFESGPYLDLGTYKQSYAPFGPAQSPQLAEHSATTELRDKVRNLEERLKKLESESLRKKQEGRDKEPEELLLYVQ